MSEDPRRRGGRWILPALIALPFVAALAYDLARAVTAPPTDVDLLAAGPLRFEPFEPVFELDEAAGATAWSEPGRRLLSGWGETGEQGTWTAGAVASLEIELGIADERVLFVEGRADRRRREPAELAVAVNEVECGTARLTRRFEPLRFELPQDVLRRGPNRVTLRVVRRSGGAPAEDRTMLVRRLALADSDRGSIDELGPGPALVVTPERGSVSIRRAGRLIVPFETTSSGSVVSLKLRLAGGRPSGRCRVVVARRFVDPTQLDIINERELDGERGRRMRVRQRIESRGESGAVLVEVDRAAAAGGAVLSELRLEARD